MTDYRDRNLTVNGITKTYKEWCIPIDISPSTLQKRLSQGMTPEEAVSKKRTSFKGAGRRSRKILKEKGMRWN